VAGEGDVPTGCKASRRSEQSSSRSSWLSCEVEGVTMILQRLSLSDLEWKEVLLPWQKLGLSYTTTGYGRRIPTTKMVRLNGRWRRIYCCCYSNSGTCYVSDKNGNWIVIVD